MNKRARTRLIIVTVLILVAVGGYLVYVSLNGGLAYYKTIAQVKAEGTKVVGQNIKVMGKVQAGTVQRTSAGLNFEITNDGKETIPVLYGGIVPATFKEKVDVIVTGQLQKDGVFAATDILTKCPTKYSAQQDAAAASGGSK